MEKEKKNLTREQRILNQKRVTPAAALFDPGTFLCPGQKTEYLPAAPKTAILCATLKTKGRNGSDL